MLIQAGKRAQRHTLSSSRASISTGFSLIELLVVIMIIGLGIRAVTLNVGGNEQRQIRQEAREFVNAATIASEEAVLTRQQWGVDFYRDVEAGEDRFGYRWLIRAQDQNQVQDQVQDQQQQPVNQIPTTIIGSQDEWRWQLVEPLQEDQVVDVLFSPKVRIRLEFDEVEQDIEMKRDITEPVSNSEELTALERQQLAAAQQGSDDEQVEPHIWMLSSGEMTPFSLFIFNVDDPENEIVINGDELGRVSIETVETIDDEQI